MSALACMEPDSAWQAAQGEGEEEETDELVGQVLDEIGITLNGEMVGVPGKEAQAAKQVCCFGLAAASAAQTDSNGLSGACRQLAASRQQRPWAPQQVEQMWTATIFKHG